MKSILQDSRKRIIKRQEEIKFSSFSSFHLIEVTTRAKSEKQISAAATDDEDLYIKIDDKTFPKLTGSKRLIDSPAAFSGGKLHNLSKTVYFLTFLKGKDHSIILKTDEEPNTATLDNFPLKSITPTVTYSRRKRDSDDVRIVIDGKIQRNILRTIKHFLKITFDFGVTPPIPEGIPIVDNPKWTKDFYDDTEDILLARLIFGEAENQSKEAKVGVGYTVVNRVKKGNPHWGLNNREVILKENQYDALWNPDRRDAVRDPLREADETTRKAWNESYVVATGILNGSLKDSTGGATHFHSYPEDEPERFPPWATEKNFKIKIGDILFYELEA